jgi:uncharacterized protein (DUF983 family)
MTAYSAVSEPVEAESRSALLGIKRGVRRLCPHCGEGALFMGYLKVRPVCPACGHDNGHYRADDGPAYFTILLVGHLVVAPLLALSFLWSLPPLLIVALGLPIVGAATLAALPVIKGAWIGVLWGTGASAGDEGLTDS